MVEIPSGRRSVLDPVQSLGELQRPDITPSQPVTPARQGHARNRIHAIYVGQTRLSFNHGSHSVRASTTVSDRQQGHSDEIVVTSPAREQIDFW
jgi:hypothetical protein